MKLRQHDVQLELYARLNEYYRDHNQKFAVQTKAASSCSPHSDMARWLGFEGLGCYTLRLGPVMYGFATLPELQAVYDLNPLPPSLYCQLPTLQAAAQPQKA